ncbi:MAG: tetratricopeptide repeat protein [Candidatus Hodarchaeales archaeon]|jgi:tetratricopeptide (TPR) repeat protein
MLKTIKYLFESGNYPEVIEKTTMVELRNKDAPLLEEEQIEIVYYRSYSLQAIGQLEQSLELATTNYTKFQENKNIQLLLLLISVRIITLTNLFRFEEAATLITEGDTLLNQLDASKQKSEGIGVPLFTFTKGYKILLSRSEIKPALNLFREALTNFKRLKTQSYIAETLGWIGRYYYFCNERKTALEYFKQSLDIFMRLNHKSGISYFLLNIGHIYYHKGRHDIKLKYYQQSLNIAEESENPTTIAWSLNSIGWTYALQSKFDYALEHSQRAIILAKKTNNALLISEVSFTMGSIYQFLGDYDKSLEFLEQALKLRKNRVRHVYEATLLFCLIKLMIDRKELSKAQSYLTRLKELYSESLVKKVRLFLQLSEAIILKQSSRMADKAHAQMILKGLLTEDTFNVSWNYAIYGLLHLCELLIFEAKASGEVEIWEETKIYIHQFYDQVKQSDNYAFISEALLLNAKIAMIEGELQQAIDFLDQAKLSATKYKVLSLSKKVDEERNRLKADFERWNELIRNNASLQKRFSQAQIEEYIQKTQQFISRRT